MLTKRFGIEIELTGITKDTAANAVKGIVGGRLQHTRDSYNTIKINATDALESKTDGEIQMIEHIQ